MLVIGLATRRWEVAVAAIAMVAFFAASGRASWVNAQGRAALIGGELRQARNRRTVAALWGLAGLAALAVAIAVLALQP